jgi:hypothetical protein
MVRCFVGGILCLHLFLFFNVRARIARGYPDFKIFYTAATIVRHGDGRLLYDPQTQYRVQSQFAEHSAVQKDPLPYNHPPYEALIFLPLTFFSFSRAFAVWDLVNLAGLLITVILLRKQFAVLRGVFLWELLFCALAYFPVFANFLQGQDSILQLLLCTIAFGSLKKGNDLNAGCWFALGLFRFQFIVPIVLLIILARRTRVAIGLGLVSLGLAWISFTLVGWEGMFHYPEFVLRGAQAHTFGAVPPELMPNLVGLFMNWPGSIAKPVGIFLVVTISAILFLLAAIRERRLLEAEKRDLQISLAFLIAVLIGGHTNSHDFCLLILPLVSVADYCYRVLDPDWRRELRLVLPIIPLLISPLWLVLWLAFRHENLMAIPVLWWAWSIGRELNQGLPPKARLSVENY